MIGINNVVVAGLNKTDQAKHYEINGSDPKEPTYAASLELFRQLRCLVSPRIRGREAMEIKLKIF